MVHPHNAKLNSKKQLIFEIKVPIKKKERKDK